MKMKLNKKKTKIQETRKKIRKETSNTNFVTDIQIENCAICRNHLMEPCIECQPNSMANGGEECIAAWGMCNHAFHLHCIKRWLKTRNACPLDNTEWVYQKFGK
ncbi:RING-box protein HRT1 [Lodderomyces elongisporus NRRL YB-4239]|uniref:RING-box protein HRT1 n=1 Tax=Lodderomyces elongisporus (strain ATCC 11503 / CBS 2605 / JCM 1781 / NBRC 1676 / NRRL YB-4239) TaxID=379508 RepID=A5DXH4_LODEL|nr:RING-box protein HRT1 [Lodderomyces elongisporus NRRL YB-4239]